MEGFRYEARHRVLICLEHQAAVAPKSLDNHLYRAHGLAHPHRQQLRSQLLENHDVAQPHEVARSPSTNNVIAGLKVEPAYLCVLPDCNQSQGHLSLHLSKVQLHRSRHHGVRHQGAEAGIQRVWAQTFFREKRWLHYFVVSERATATPSSLSNSVVHHGSMVPGANDIHRSYHEAQLAWARKFDEVKAPEHPSQESPWMKRTGFAEHLQGIDKASILQATIRPSRSRQKAQNDHADDSGESGCSANAPPLALTGSTINANDHPTGLVIVADSCLTLLNKAHAAAGQSGSDARLHPRDAMVLNSLEQGRTQSEPFRQLQDPRSLARYAESWVRFLAYVWRLTDRRTALELRRLLLLNQRQQDCVSLLKEVATEQGQRPTNDETPGWLSEMEQMVLEVSLAFIEHSLAESPYASGLLSYVAARSLKLDGSWKTPTYMTSFLASITYNIQLLLFANARWQADQPDGEAFQLLLSKSCRRWLVNGRPTPSAEVLSWRLYARKVSSSTLPTAYTSWSLDSETVTYRDSVMTMTEWRMLIRQQVQRASQILNQHLLLNRDDRPQPRAKDLLDVETETRAGYSFTHDPRNGMEMHGRWVLDSLLKDSNMQESLIEIRDGTVIWRGHQVNSYLNHAKVFLEHLLLAMHLTGGLPGRAPEILSLRHCNDEEPRNVMIHDGQVMFITGYHKMQYAAGSRLVCRFLPAMVGDLLVRYLAMVLPFARYLEGLQGRASARAFLFASSPTPWTEDRLTEVMRRESRRLLGMELVASAYRHIAIAIDRRHLRGMGAQAMGLQQDGEPADNESHEIGNHVNDLQASHSTLTSNMSYANSVSTGRMFNDPKLNQFRQTSLSWHELAQRTDSVRSKRSRTDSMRLSPNEPPAPTPPGWNANVTSQARPSRRWDSNELEVALRQVHGPDACPRSEGQWDALCRVAEGVAQLVVVLPTGGGKSLLFQLPSVLPGAGVAVVILPLVVLRQDLVGKCTKLGLSHQVWSSSMDETSRCAPLLLVGVEDACGRRFLGLLRRLSLEGRLDRICMDEAQMVLTDASYREALRQVQQVRRVPVPFLALTATLPPALETELSKTLFMDRPLIIRRSVDRPNLAYLVLEQEQVLGVESGSMTLIDAAVRILTEQLPYPEDGDGRTLCFVPTKKLAEELAERLGCQAYHAGLSHRDKIYQDWLDGRQRILVGTKAIGAGVDFPQVRQVLHVGPPSSAMGYSQESGRAGRDGQPATCLVLLGRAQAGGEADSIDLDRAAMHHMLSATVRCRRQALTAYLDGGDGVCCVDETKLALCDRCLHTSRGEPFVAGLQHPSPSQDLSKGDQLARAAMREEETGRARYREGLLTWSQRCMTCFFSGTSQDWQHPPCRLSKEHAAQLGRGRSQLDFAPHIGCFHCGNPEWLCNSQGRAEHCNWDSTVLNLCFVCHTARGHAGMKRIREEVMPATVRRPQVTELFRWMGGANRLYGAPAFNANVLVDRIFLAFP